jgi:glycosyltransferase involved in cell wall biosynthesis
MSILRIFRRAVAEFQPEIVYACWAYPDGWAAWRLARECGLPVAVKVHGSDLLLLQDASGRKRRTVELLRDADAISAVSADLRHCAVRMGTPANRAHLIYEGTDRKLFCPGDRRESRRALGLNPEGLRLLFVGNLVPVKAIPNLISACRRLLDSGLSVDADIIGEGPEHPALAQQISRLELSRQVHLWGAKSQDVLPQWYRAANLVVICSHSEGVPNVLVEAAACGIPFVATNVGGIPEIAHLSRCRLVPPNDVDALALAIDRILRDVSAETACTKIETVPSVADCSKTTLELFAQILGGRADAARRSAAFAV